VTSKDYRLYCFDIDGTLIRSFLREGGGRHLYDAVEVLPGRIERIAELREANVAISLVTNQGGVAFGYQYLDQVHRKIRGVVQALGFSLHPWVADSPANSRTFVSTPYVPVAYVAFGHPKARLPQYVADDDWRKPGGGMLAQAAKDRGVDLADVLFVGDMDTDREAAEAAGVDYMDAAAFFGSAEA
jgi:D-glycero-D-manno-heptose 1,7-bisphosphate phosphatase